MPLARSAPESNNNRETDELLQLRQDLTSMTVQMKQLDEANQAWQQYQQNQLSILRDRLKLPDIDNLPFEDVVQQLENRFSDLDHQITELQEGKGAFLSIGFRWIILFACRIPNDYRHTTARNRGTSS